MYNGRPCAIALDHSCCVTVERLSYEIAITTARYGYYWLTFSPGYHSNYEANP